MSHFKAMGISAAGMSAQRLRLDIATSNLANAETTRGPDGGPYRRADPVFKAEFLDGTRGISRDSVASVRVDRIVHDLSEGRPVYNPDHPDANEEGIVMLPNVNPIHEVVNLMSATRGYEANATAFETLKNMAKRALEILR